MSIHSIPIRTNILLPDDDEVLILYPHRRLDLQLSQNPSLRHAHEKRSLFVHSIDDVVRNEFHHHDDDSDSNNDSDCNIDSSNNSNNKNEYNYDPRILNVLQGEVAHATAEQCDIMVSQHATTCHIVLLRSMLHLPLYSPSCTCQCHSQCNSSLDHNNENDVPIDGSDASNIYKCPNHSGVEQGLCSMAHMDRVSHVTPGLEDMLLQHLIPRNSCCSCRNDRTELEIQVHILGGFLDEEGLSIELTNAIIWELHRLAKVHTKNVKLRLCTCLVSLMNDTGDRKPRSSGLGIKLQSGSVYLLSSVWSNTGSQSINETNLLHSDLGPAKCLRRCRLFSSDSHSLMMVHNHCSDGFMIQPFKFGMCPSYLEELLNCSDTELLRRMSTSPSAEHANFCVELRSDLKFMKSWSWWEVFGSKCSFSLVFHRLLPNNDERQNHTKHARVSNQWKLQVRRYVTKANG